MRSVRILVNATTITVGGGVQAAISFIEHAARKGPSGVEFLFAVSIPVYEGLEQYLRNDERVHAFADSPAQPWRGRRVRRQLVRLEKEFLPDLVYSIGFPSYVVFKATEAGRYTNPWEICALPVARSRLPVPEQAMRWFKSLYRLWWAQYAKYFETQTEVARAGIIRKLGVEPARVFVFPNSVNSRFLEAARTIGPKPRKPRIPTIFCLSAAHRHKNLTMIPAVAMSLRAKFGLDCSFVLTLPNDSSLWQSIMADAARRGVRQSVTNVGPLTLDACVEHYRDSDCLFLPTLAEIFSASYLEAMIMAVPIVTVDLDFARTVCNDAAIYYDALSPEAAADAIHSVLTDDALRQTLIRNGRQRFAEFPDPETKHQRLLDWLVSISKIEKAVIQ